MHFLSFLFFPFGLDIHPLYRPQSGAAGVRLSWIHGSRLDLSHCIVGVLYLE